MGDRDGSHMAAEIEATPQAVRDCLAGSGEAIRAAGERLRSLDPPVLATCARGSSDHAATLFKYACEIGRGTPVASLGPSLASVYGARLRLKRGAALAISQSGQSPDLVALIRAAKDGGAATFAIVNDPESPLAQSADHVIDIRAGVERSVAATKTCIASTAASLALLAAWSEDDRLADALAELPNCLEAALALDWSEAEGALASARSLYVLGRGPAFAIAQEAALKFKETAGLHAEAFSGAEIMHGPVSLVGRGFPVLAFLPDDAALPGMMETLQGIGTTGAAIFTAGGSPAGANRLPSVPTLHPLTEALAMLLSFYRLVEAVARARGRDPDHPRHLRKVTETV